MPLSVNVGLSRKASKDYQSSGVSINVTAELDSALLAKPTELQSQIDALYGQAEQAIERHVHADTIGAASAATTHGKHRGKSDAGNGRANVNRNGNGNQNGSGNGGAGNGHANGQDNGGSVTRSQARAIEAIANRAGLDATQEAHDLFAVSLDAMSLQQASELIDHLKSQLPAENSPAHPRR